jgi:pimeloyl-ACP methyl ester carboxylesterase
MVRRQAHPAAPGQPLGGGPQMVEISRDGKHVYVTNSLYAAWDEVFYPEGVGACPTDLPILRDLLPGIQTAVQHIAGRRDEVVPVVNSEYLHERLPHSKLDVIEAGHFTWEEAPDEYAALVTSWWNGGYAAV